MEATGVYWIQFAEAMHTAGFAVSVVNPMQIKRFAQVSLRRDKTDPIDAQTITQFAVALPHLLNLWTPPPPIYEEVYQRLLQRDTLARAMLQEGNRLHALNRRTVSIPTVQARADASIRFMEAQVKVIDKELLDLLENGAWAENARRLLSIKSIGVVTAGWLLVATVNFSTCESVRQLSAYAGLVPRQRQSGTSLNKRPNVGFAPHPRLRHALVIATMSALQHNPPIRAFYKKLRAQGMAGKKAQVAAARKLLKICWACVKKGREFDAGYADRWR